MKLFGKTEIQEPEDQEIKAYRQSVQTAKLPEHVEEAANQELDRLEKTHPSTPEYTIGIGYLDYLLSLPWNKFSEDNLDLKQAEVLLNRAHYGLRQVKDRILEYLAVRILRARHKPTILVADDEEIIRNNLERVLTKEGYSVQMAVDGTEALYCLENREYDVVLTDIKMGLVDGLQVLNRVKERNPETRVVMLTAHATVDSVVEAMKKGAFNYLTKPFKLDDVRQAIKDALQQKGRLGYLRGPALCFVGPPGTGKTTLGRSIADALGRKFIRISLAGLRDEAELRGHRRTYVGALPGRIIQEISRSGVNNPVILLDEIDKAIQNLSGNPVAALLEILDPEQNHAFMDYYLGLPYDLSGVLFIATANIPDPIPPALLDRMEVLSLSAYSEPEKMRIAVQHIIPRQIRENGLAEYGLNFSPEAALKIIQEYTNEAGLRNLEREIATVCRKVAREILIREPDSPVSLQIKAENVESFLGPKRMHREAAGSEDRVGLATGLVWSEKGGEIIFIEATIMPGSSQLILTGSLGEVMQESAQAALSYLRANTQLFNLKKDFFTGFDIHIHVPSGAIQKDGPSAGLPIAMSLLSLLKSRPARKDTALTGELTLSGRVLPVGGLKEKVLAAKRAGLKKVIVPAQNQNEIENLSLETLDGLDVRFVHSMTDVLDLALGEPTGESA